MYVEALKITYNDEEYLDLVEKYWQSKWKDSKTFQTKKDLNLKKYYV